MDSMDIQIIDPANLPDEDRPVAPRKSVIIMVGFFVGVMLSVSYAMVGIRQKE